MKGLKDSIVQLQRKKEELELQTNEAGLSIEELKQRLVQKAKEQTLEKNNLDKLKVTTEQELQIEEDKYQEALKQLEAKRKKEELEQKKKEAEAKEVKGKGKKEEKKTQDKK